MNVSAQYVHWANVLTRDSFQYGFFEQINVPVEYSVLPYQYPSGQLHSLPRARARSPPRFTCNDATHLLSRPHILFHPHIYMVCVSVARPMASLPR